MRYEDAIEQANQRIVELKKERKGFWNLFNGYRKYCNMRIDYWNQFKEWCVEGMSKK